MCKKCVASGLNLLSRFSAWVWLMSIGKVPATVKSNDKVTYGCLFGSTGEGHDE